jgi:hypothetical protein
MSVIEVAGASAPSALVLDTPTLLDSQSTAGVYQLFIDTNNMAAGDVLIIRSRVKVVSGGTARLFEEKVLGGVTGPKAFCTEPIEVAWYVEYELEQTEGTGRIFPWSVVRG